LVTNLSTIIGRQSLNYYWSTISQLLLVAKLSTIIGPQSLNYYWSPSSQLLLVANFSTIFGPQSLNYHLFSPISFTYYFFNDSKYHLTSIS